MTNTATVETLTAEVRVLMVGSRQVTLSVAKQLDVVALADLTTFGRVKLGLDYDYVIGADVHGRLALATYKRYGLRGGPWINGEDLGGQKVIVCKARARSDGYLRLRYRRDREIQVHSGAMQGCEVSEHDSFTRDRCGSWDTNGCDDHLEFAIAQYDAEVARHKAAAEAPLIVLAGLR